MSIVRSFQSKQNSEFGQEPNRLFTPELTSHVPEQNRRFQATDLRRKDLPGFQIIMLVTRKWSNEVHGLPVKETWGSDFHILQTPDAITRQTFSYGLRGSSCRNADYAIGSTA